MTLTEVLLVIIILMLWSIFQVLRSLLIWTVDDPQSDESILKVLRWAEIKKGIAAALLIGYIIFVVWTI